MNATNTIEKFDKATQEINSTRKYLLKKIDIIDTIPKIPFIIGLSIICRPIFLSNIPNAINPTEEITSIPIIIL